MTELPRFLCAISQQSFVPLPEETAKVVVHFLGKEQLVNGHLQTLGELVHVVHGDVCLAALALTHKCPVHVCFVCEFFLRPSMFFACPSERDGEGEPRGNLLGSG